MTESKGIEFVCTNGIKLFIPDEIIEKSEFGELRHINKDNFKRQKINQIEVPFCLSGFKCFHVMNLIGEWSSYLFLFDVISGFNFFCPSMANKWEFEYNGIHISADSLLPELGEHSECFKLPPQSDIAKISLKMPNGKAIKEEQIMKIDEFFQLVSSVPGYEKVVSELIWGWAFYNSDFPFFNDVDNINNFCSNFFKTESFHSFFTGNNLESKLLMLFEKQWIVKLNDQNYQLLIEDLCTITSHFKCFNTSSFSYYTLIKPSELSMQLIESILKFDQKQMMNLWSYFSTLNTDLKLSNKIICRLLPYFTKTLKKSWFNAIDFKLLKNVLHILINLKSTDENKEIILDFLFSLCCEFDTKTMKEHSIYESSFIDLMKNSIYCDDLIDKILYSHHNRKEMPILFENLGQLLTPTQ